MKYPEPRHDTIIEPFAGAAGYATRYHDRRVILVEKDPRIAALWRFLIRATRNDILDIPLMTLDGHLDDLKASEEAKILVSYWLQPASSHPKKSFSTWAKKYPGRGKAWDASIRERIAAQVECIKHWTVIEGTYADSPNIEATWFVDPPYQLAGKYYRYSSASIDFTHLGNWCRSRKGLVAVCENVGADWLPFEKLATIQTARNNVAGIDNPEAIYLQTNGRHVVVTPYLERVRAA